MSSKPTPKPRKRKAAPKAKKPHGRPPATTPEQDEEIRKRLLAGESGASIARAMNVSERHVGRLKREGQKKGGEQTRLPTDAIREAAKKSVENDLNDPAIKGVLEAAGMEDRDLFHSLKADITETALILSMAGKLGATSAKRLAAMALLQLDQIQDPATLQGQDAEAIKRFIALQHASNIASTVPLELMKIASRRGGGAQEGETRTIKLVNEPDIK